MSSMGAWTNVEYALDTGPVSQNLDPASLATELGLEASAATETDSAVLKSEFDINSNKLVRTYRDVSG